MAAELSDFDDNELRIVSLLLNHYDSHLKTFLSHSVDKMFEEAELSGVLLLNGRKLKEFPSELASKFDISDVIFADLSENRLNELPMCICELGSMETLRVRSAGLRTLPNSFQFLNSLTYLDLSCNHLTTLPPGICSLRLQVLLLTGNLLETLPREIRQFSDTLNELDVSCNRLRTIPVDVALLKSLRVLNLRANRLSHLPSELSRLELRVFNVSENELTELPFDLCCMPSLIDLCVDANPFIAPPVKVCSKGREHIFKWLRTKAAPLTDGFSKQFEWPQRPVSVAVNATMRRTKHQEIFALAENEAHSFGKRVERRNRSTRFNTLGGSDSGYASTADEHRLSNEYQLPVNSGTLFGINESLRTPPSDRDSPKSNGMNSSGDRTITSECSSPVMEDSTGLLKEVMLAYAEKMGEATSETFQKNKTPVSQREPTESVHSDEMTFIPHSTAISLSASSTLLYSSSLSRPQAIVSPMSSKPQVLATPAADESDNLYFKAIKSDSVVHIIDETESIKKAVLMSSKSNGTLDESNNNIPEDIAKNSRRDEAFQKLIRSSNLFSKHAGKEPLGRSFSSALDAEMGYVNSRHPSSLRRRMENTDNAAILSPVIEMPAPSENGNVVQDSCSSSATCVNPSPSSSVSTTVSCSSTAESVSSTVKMPLSKKTKNLPSSVGPSVSHAALSTSTSDKPSTATARSTALRRPVASSQLASRIAPRPSTTVPLSHSKDSKLTKARDSIGVARRHMVSSSVSNNGLRKSTVVGRSQFDENGSNGTTSGISLMRRNIENMRKALENRLNTTLPTDQDQLATRLSDGTLLCNFANRISGRVIPNILTSASQQVPLSLPKCRRNAENFLSACRRVGVTEVLHDIVHNSEKRLAVMMLIVFITFLCFAILHPF